MTKCQAALRTLQSFPFFNPTCLCKVINDDDDDDDDDDYYDDDYDDYDDDGDDNDDNDDDDFRSHGWTPTATSSKISLLTILA